MHDKETGAADVNEGFVMHVERRRPWRFVAAVWLFEGNGASPSDPERLITVQALTRRGARRRGARVIAARQDLLWSG
jgi:hypothetical protein